MSPSRPPDAVPGKPWYRHWTIIAIVVFLGLVGYYQGERAMGERCWESYRKEAAERGVRLEYKEFETPPIPDEENYVAAPVFRWLSEGEDDAYPGINRFELLKRVSEKVNWNWTRFDALDLKDWPGAFLKEGWIAAAGSSPAADVISALERYAEPLAAIREASQRPKSRWPAKWLPLPLNNRGKYSWIRQPMFAM